MQKILEYFEKYKKELLIFITLSVVLIFVFILYKSYKISKIKYNINNLPVVSSKIEQIKVKNEIKDSNTNSNNDDFYNNILNNEDENLKIEKIDDNRTNSENFADEKTLNNKIDELVNNDYLETDNYLNNTKNISENTTIPDENNRYYKNNITNGGYKVQLIALQNELQTKNFIELTKKKFNNLLKNLEIFYTKADLGEKGLFYRVNVGYFNTKNEAGNFCEAYLKIGNKDRLNCIIVK